MSTKINWFEIPTSNFSRAVTFYETVFNTKLSVEPCGNDQMGIFMLPDGEGCGCLVQGDKYRPSTDGSLLYLDASPSIDRVLDRIASAGGTIRMPKFELPEGMGYIAHFDDTEGNRVALHALS